MKLLIAVIVCALSVASALPAQTGLLSIGEGIKIDTGTKQVTNAFDLLATYKKLGLTAQLSKNFHSYQIGNRQYPFKHFFISESIKKAEFGTHPYYLSPGVGIDIKPFARERVYASCSETNHLKTVQVGFGCAVQSYYDIGHDLSIRFAYSRTKLDTLKGPSIMNSQISIGLNYSWKF